jgi:hypothetical protein
MSLHGVLRARATHATLSPDNAKGVRWQYARGRLCLLKDDRQRVVDENHRVFGSGARHVGHGLREDQ